MSVRAGESAAWVAKYAALARSARVATDRTGWLDAGVRTRRVAQRPGDRGSRFRIAILWVSSHESSSNKRSANLIANDSIHVLS